MGFTSEILTVTVNAGNAAAVTPTGIRVTPGDSQSLIVERELPTGGSIPYAYGGLSVPDPPHMHSPTVLSLRLAVQYLAMRYPPEHR